MTDRSRAPHLIDVAVALGFLAIGWAGSSAATTSEPDFVYAPRDGLFALLLVLATVPYAWRRTLPSTAFVITLLAMTVLWSLGYNGAALPMVLLVGAYWVAMARPVTQVSFCSGVAMLCFAWLWWAGGAPYGVTEATASVIGVAGAMGLGRADHLRADLAEARTRAAEEAARRAIGEERLRVAAELHDIIGHSLGTIAVQAGVGRHLMADDPQHAAEALDHIARLSRDSLDEVRAVVAALREDEPAYHPTPGLADLPHLVDTARAAGLTVQLRLPDDLGEIPRQAGAAAYRITREALTNVIRHAHATTVSIDVSHRDGRVEVTIRDDGTASSVGNDRAGSGHGIAGMRQRAEALGGSLSAGPCPQGGFLVIGTIPNGARGPQ